MLIFLDLDSLRGRSERGRGSDVDPSGARGRTSDAEPSSSRGRASDTEGGGLRGRVKERQVMAKRAQSAHSSLRNRYTHIRFN